MKQANVVIHSHNFCAVLDSQNKETDLLLVCPKCRYFCTHVETVHCRKGRDADEAEDYGIPLEASPEGPYQWRRSAVVLTVWCEAGHNFNLVIQQHKGQTYVWTEELPDEPNEEYEEGNQ